MKWLLPLSHLISSSEYKQCISLCLALRMGQWVRGGHKLGVKRSGVAERCDALVLIRVCYTSRQALLWHHLRGQNSSPACHASFSHPWPLGACSGHKNIRLKLLFKLWLQKCIFFCQVNATSAFYWPAIGRRRTDPSCSAPTFAFAMHSLQR